jgi:hypothetical protein
MILPIIHFQQKLILPTLSVAVGVGIAGYFSIWSTPFIQGTGFGYILAGPLTHYFIYELRHPNEYYFYFNLGLNKSILYAATAFINFIISGLILYYA